MGYVTGRRRRLAIGVAGTLALLVTSALTVPAASARGDHTAGSEAGPTPHNIVFILSDDQRWDTMYAMPKTRDLIGNEGVTFTQATVTNSLCCPSRSTILTGTY